MILFNIKPVCQSYIFNFSQSKYLQTCHSTKFSIASEEMNTQMIPVQKENTTITFRSRLRSPLTLPASLVSNSSIEQLSITGTNITELPDSLLQGCTGEILKTVSQGMRKDFFQRSYFHRFESVADPRWKLLLSATLTLLRNAQPQPP